MWMLLSFLSLQITLGIIPALFFKLEASGSTWMTSKLNAYKGVFITREIFRDTTGGDVHKEGQSYLMKSFSTPQRPYKLQWNKKVKKPDEDFHVLGATMNPFWAKFLNWTELAYKVPNLKLVVYRRSNVVKHAISFIRGILLVRKCKTPVVDGDCKLDKTLEVDPTTLRKQINRLIARDNYLAEVANGLAAHLNSWFYVMHYEELLQDDETVIDRLFEWIGKFPKELRVEPVHVKCSYTNCTKNTSDDLKKVILNFEEVEGYIKENLPCLLSHLRETKPDRVMPSIHSECPALVQTGARKPRLKMSLKHRK
jgi:hypothetical protein